VSLNPPPPAPAITLGEHALGVALRELVAGAREVGGDNRGPFVKKYLAPSGLGEGFAWCAAFVSWCVREAVRERPACAMPFKYASGAKRLMRQLRERGFTYDPELTEPKAGDIVCWHRGGIGGPLGHIAFVVEVQRREGGFPGERTLVTLEGNNGPKVKVFHHPFDPTDPMLFGLARLP
jgi:hypothetical protein